MKLKLFLAFTIFAATTLAQKTEVGGLVGVGGFAAEDVPTSAYWVAGAEACFLCDGRFALYVDYNHYGSTGSNRATHITSVDLFSGGLRIQRSQGRVRPFFDIGVTGGQDHFRSRLRPSSHQSHNLVGVGLGGGATVSMGERWYVRPAVRLQGMSGFHVGVSVAASVGYRF